ncbi:MAG: hypothetical protein JWM90_1158, partial [Thermoleophilia bacterium]|nr:hypothetical protein [Thermoleophilia bacterium]
MVDALQPLTRRRRAAPASTPAAAVLARVPARELPQGPAKTYRTFEVANPSKAGGEWQVDWERAHADAQKVLDAIDFSKRDIELWIPGTSNHGPHPAFEPAVRDS